MKDENKMQAEDNSAVDEAEEKSVAQTTAAGTPKGFFDRALPWVIVTLVAFLVGALLTWFVVHQPKVAALETKLAAAQSEAAAAAEKNTSLEGELEAANTDLTAAKNDLGAAQTTIEGLTADLAKSEQYKVIYKFQADVNTARATLSKLDPASSKQALSYVSADLAELEKTNLEPDALSGFKARIEEANANLETAPQKSLEAMETLYSNLLLIISNLK